MCVLFVLSWIAARILHITYLTLHYLDKHYVVRLMMFYLIIIIIFTLINQAVTFEPTCVVQAHCDKFECWKQYRAAKQESTRSYQRLNNKSLSKLPSLGIQMLCAVMKLLLHLLLHMSCHPFIFSKGLILVTVVLDLGNIRCESGTHYTWGFSPLQGTMHTHTFINTHTVHVSQSTYWYVVVF